MDVSFKDFGLASAVEEGVSIMGYESPTPIQREAIPAILSGRDVLGCAQTGTGKTAAYLLPLLSRVVTASSRVGDETSVLVISPTRELALQIDQQVEGFGYYAGVSSIAIYGGSDSRQWSEQSEAVRRGADILVATPGRLLQFVELGVAKLDKVKTLVLDEADRMLDMGFLPDIKRIVELLPKERQTLLFSATMPDEIKRFALEIQNNPVEISLSVSKPAEKIKQEKVELSEGKKVGFIVRFFEEHQDVQSAVIFAERKTTVKRLAMELAKRKLSVAAMHSDLDQTEREENLRLFKARQVRILVATDIVSRGIDVEDIALVVNFNVPQTAEAYVHRVGRTARAENNGWALTLVGPAERREMGDIERFLGTKVPAMEGAERLMPAKEEVALDQPRRRSSGGARGSNGNGRRGGEKRKRAAGAGGSGRSAQKGRAEVAGANGGRTRKQQRERTGEVGAKPAASSRGDESSERRRRSRGRGSAPKGRGQGEVKSGDGRIAGD